LLERIAADTARPGPDGQFRCRAVAPRVRSVANQFELLILDEQVRADFEAGLSGTTVNLFGRTTDKTGP
jgi:hypothetical protein